MQSNTSNRNNKDEENMLKAIISILLLAIVGGSTQAAPASGEIVSNDNVPVARSSSTWDHFTLGGSVQGAAPIYYYSNILTYDDIQKEVTINIDYPVNDSNQVASNESSDQVADVNDQVAEVNDLVITQVDLYIEGSDGFETQALVQSGGIGERSISLEVVVSNTEVVRYMVIVYATKVA